MSCYQTRHRQRSAISYRDLPKKVGENFSIHFRVALLFFVRSVQDFAYRRFVTKQDYSTLTLPSPNEALWKFEMQRSSFHVSNNEENTIHRILTFMETLVDEYVAGGISAAHGYFYMKMYFSSLSDSMHRLVLRSQTGDITRDVLVHSEIQELCLWGFELTNSFDLDPCAKLEVLVTKAYVLYRYGRQKFEEANEVLDEAIKFHDILSTTSGYIWDRYVDIEIQIRNAALEPSVAIQYFQKALKSSNVSLHMQYVYEIGIARSMWIQGMEHKANNEAEKLTRDLFHDSQVLCREHYIRILRLLRKTFIEFQNVKLDNFVLDMLYEILDLNIAGDLPGDIDVAVKLNMLKHYKYNFGRDYNVGKYANFTYKILDYENPLYVLTLTITNAYALKLFSSVRYGDLLTQIPFALNADEDTSYLRVAPRECRKMWMQTKLISLMVLCESVKYKDFELFGNLLKSTRSIVLKAKILQPFIYSCLNEYSSHPKAERKVVVDQNVLFREVFQTFESAPSTMKNVSISAFLNFNFKKSTDVMWKLLRYQYWKNEGIDSNEFEVAEELFLTMVLTIMMVRKRQSPLPHLRKCRELSLMQSLWLKGADLDDNREYYAISQDIKLSSLYASRSHSLALLHNLAVNCLVYDERACSALVWKLIHSGKLDDDLYEHSVILLFEALDRICEDTLVPSFTHRMS